MSRHVRKRTYGHVRPAKIQISLRNHAFRSDSALGAFWIAIDAKFLDADNEDANQTARMRSLICVFVGRTYPRLRFMPLKLKKRMLYC